MGIKAITEPLGRPPTTIGRSSGQGFQQAYFCDWTEQGTLLCNVSTNGSTWQLALFDRNGQLVNTLGTPVPVAKGVVASWRKYGHR